MTSTSGSADGLRRHAQHRSDVARARIEQSLRHLRKTKSTININAVAVHARVSRKTVYQHTDLVELIRAHKRTAQPIVEVADTEKPDSIVAGLRNMLTAKDNQIADLRRELRDRDDTIAALHGEIERLISQHGQR